MKLRILKYVAFIAIISLITVACIPVTANAADYNYEKNGLKALYVGNNNTGSGQDKNATVWKDLSGNKLDITTAPKDSKNYFNDTGYHLDSTKVALPNAIKDVINSTEFTVEVAIGDFSPLGTSWNTLINSSNDSFALFRTKSDNTLNFKSQTTLSTGNKANARPSTTDAEKNIKNSTITITFKLGGKITMYVNGVQVGEKKDAVNQINCDDFYFGHNDALKNHVSEYRAMRFYSKELTAAQVKANYEVDKAILGKAYDGGTSISSSSSSTSANSSSTSAAPSTSSTAASSSKPASSSSTTSTSNPKTGDSSVYVYAILGCTALTSMIFVIRNRKAVKER
jgi:LPXTG-motif cell wall-anchored protein